MGATERSDQDEADGVWRWSEPEPVSPDDPIVNGNRWRRERDEAREQLRGAVCLDEETLAVLDRRATTAKLDRAGYLRWVVTGKEPATSEGQ